uniref:Protein kinase domain-containing protein n=2 Tax=Iconisemion striatum TaxID=60296 RepID=A0A1A7WKJ3_9TELE
MRVMVKLLGQPDKRLLDAGYKTERFFTLEHSGSAPFWTLKSLDEFEWTTGETVKKSSPVFDSISSLDDLLDMSSKMDDPEEVEDLKAFLDLLKRMLSWNPADRIQPDDALNHPFIIMEHLSKNRNSSYVTAAHEIMAGFQTKDPDSFTAGDADGSVSVIKSTSSEDKDAVSNQSGFQHIEKGLGSFELYRRRRRKNTKRGRRQN